MSDRLLNYAAALEGIDLDIEAEMAFTTGPTAQLRCSMQPLEGGLHRRLRVLEVGRVRDDDRPLALARGVLLHQVVDAVGGADVVERTDVRMIERRNRARFTLERRISRSTIFVAQWRGDEERAGGTRAGGPAFSQAGEQLAVDGPPKGGSEAGSRRGSDSEPPSI